MVTTVLVPILFDNVVWILTGGASDEAVVVDPGEAVPVQRELEARRLRCAAVLVTHHHADHTDGIAQLVERWHCPVFGPDDSRIPILDHPVREGETVATGGCAFDVLEVPGHTASHIAFRIEDRLLTGDTLFAGGCGRLFEGSPADMFRSLQRLAAFPPQYQIACAHEYTVDNLRFAREVEPENRRLAERLDAMLDLRRRGLPTLPSRLEEELDTNPFLRTAHPDVIDAAARRAGRSLPPGLEVFTVLRAWKDGWKAG